MSFGQLLYQLLIFPLEIVIEVVYGLSFIILRSYGWAIFPLSLAVNLLLLPFYKRADSIQREESDRQKQMAPYLSHIKKSFHGDERYMMIQAYYRENKYRPVYALRSSLPLLLQFPPHRPEQRRQSCSGRDAQIPCSKVSGYRPILFYLFPEGDARRGIRTIGEDFRGTPGICPFWVEDRTICTS